MKKNDEFYVPYIEGSLGRNTKKTIKKFVLAALLILVAGGLIFSFSQKSFKNSTFELTSETKIVGVYHEMPYPMLQVEVAKNTHKNILLLGFGKSSAHPFLEKIQGEVQDLNGKTLSIEGNLIYYNGKTLLQITDEEKVTLVNESKAKIPVRELVSEMTLKGEIIDPKCYFGVMKPGKGKIHRSCAVRCISGGIPPVLATTDQNNISEYYLVTDIHGNPVHKEILPYIGKPSEIRGVVEKMGDWYFLKIDIATITTKNTQSAFY
ncbi:MAG: hypothetical protein GKR88_01615 [Flavobacteriaceae bacterium]|nr:MAG: hypothetical protein GKR88_01615 [Flavobacteriaceae bacterium]